LKASEHREITKLDKIRNENNRLLKELESISKGKKLSVGIHSIRNPKKKSLHYEKCKKDAELIDRDNTLILDAILKAKPSVPMTSNKKGSHFQEKLLKNISKTKR